MFPPELTRSLQPKEDPEELFMQEERRLLYVAMTRAEHNLYLTYSRRYGTNKEETDPSQFLLDLNFEFNPLHTDRRCASRRSARACNSSEPT